MTTVLPGCSAVEYLSVVDDWLHRNSSVLCDISYNASQSILYMYMYMHVHTLKKSKYTHVHEHVCVHGIHVYCTCWTKIIQMHTALTYAAQLQCTQLYMQNYNCITFQNNFSTFTVHVHTCSSEMVIHKLHVHVQCTFAQMYNQVQYMYVCAHSLDEFAVEVLDAMSFINDQELPVPIHEVLLISHTDLIRGHHHWQRVFTN